MKKIVFIISLIVFSLSGVRAQRLITGVKAPDLKVSEWLSKAQLESGKPTLFEFFFSRSEASLARLDVMDDFAQDYGKRLNVIVVACESKDKVQAILSEKKYVFAVGLDPDRKVFTSYGAQFVPYGVLLDVRGKVIWFGNSSKFDEAALKQALAWD